MKARPARTMMPTAARGPRIGSRLLLLLLLLQAQATVGAVAAAFARLASRAVAGVSVRVGGGRRVGAHVDAS